MSLWQSGLKKRRVPELVRRASTPLTTTLTNLYPGLSSDSFTVLLEILWRISAEICKTLLR